jgi:molybdopterin molybdotransferase
VTAPPLLPDEARALVADRVVRLPAEPVPLAACLARVTATDVIAGLSVPPFDNSAMDGYALRSADVAASAGRPAAPLRIVDESRAGRPASRGPGSGEALRISTGAMLPAGADAVVPVERAVETDGEVRVEGAVAPGANVRRAGEDVSPGDVVVAAGARIGAAELGVLASVGAATVSCVRQPSVALIATGDELVPPGRVLGPGQIHETNTHSLRALVAEAGAQVATLDTVGDDAAAATRAVIERALRHDVVVICGGVSVGRHDHVKGMLAGLGVEKVFWRVALKPGKPTWFGVAAAHDGGSSTLVFGLPGNPVSSMVTFQLFVRPALNALLGLAPAARVAAVLGEPHAKPAGRVEYVGCRIEARDDGLHARPTRTAQGSHILTSMLGADGLAVMPAGRELIEAGERVEVELLGGWRPPAAVVSGG